MTSAQAKLPCKMVFLDLTYGQAARQEETGRRVPVEDIWYEVRAHIVCYCSELKAGIQTLPQSRIFSVNYGDRPIARFEFP